MRVCVFALVLYPFTHSSWLFFSFMRWQVLVELAELQNREAGDGTTSVAIGSAEFLKVIEA